MTGVAPVCDAEISDVRPRITTRPLGMLLRGAVIGVVFAAAGASTASGVSVVSRTPIPKECDGTTAVGGGNDLWVSCGAGPRMRAASVVHLSASGRLLGRFRIPKNGLREPGGSRVVQEMIPGSRGSIWYTDHEGQVGHITRGGKVVAFHAARSEGTVATGGLVIGRDGNLWFTATPHHGARAHGSIVRMTSNGQMTQFPVTTLRAFPGAPILGPDGALWFGESQQGSGGQIGRITTDGAITEYPLKGSNDARLVGSDGNLYFTASNGHRIARVTPAGAVTFLPRLPFELTDPILGPDGNLWFSARTGRQTGRFFRMTPRGTIRQFRVPAALSNQFYAISVSGPGGAMWAATGKADNKPTSHLLRITTAGTVTRYHLGGPNSMIDPFSGGEITPRSSNSLWVRVYDQTNQSNRTGRFVYNVKT